MPAKRHGRPGKAGRPSDAPGALRELANSAVSPAMRALGNKAADEGNGLKRLATAAGIRRAESLSRSILTDKPNAKTVEKLAQALFPRDAALIARALLAKLPRHECRVVLRKILDREGKRVFGEATREVLIHEGELPPRVESRRSNWDPILATNHIVYWLEEDAPPGVLEEAARVAVLAKYGLEDAVEGGRVNDPVLGRVLGALERLLKKHKLGSLRSFLRIKSMSMTSCEKPPIYSIGCFMFCRLAKTKSKNLKALLIRILR